MNWRKREAVNGGIGPVGLCGHPNGLQSISMIWMGRPSVVYPVDAKLGGSMSWKEGTKGDIHRFNECAWARRWETIWEVCDQPL